MTWHKLAGSRVWREPLVHFLAIGAALFLAFSWRSGGSGSARIVVTPGQIDALTAAYTKTWQRPPSEAELKGQVDEYVREEIATREAMALGLDREDTVIRRRLRQKLEFLAEDTFDAVAATDAELDAFLAAHPKWFRTDPEVSFRQVYLNVNRRGSAVQQDARALRARLTRDTPDVDIEALGDAVLLPAEVSQATRTDVARQFGDDFADAILTSPLGAWSEPIQSAYGVHLVFVRERTAARLPTLAEVRPQVERQFLADRRARQLDAMYRNFLARYRVVIEGRKDPAQ